MQSAKKGCKENAQEDGVNCDASRLCSNAPLRHKIQFLLEKHRSMANEPIEAPVCASKWVPFVAAAVEKCSAELDAAEAASKQAHALHTLPFVEWRTKTNAAAVAKPFPVKQTPKRDLWLDTLLQ